MQEDQRTFNRENGLMLASNAKRLKKGDVIFNTHYRRKEKVVRIMERPENETNKRIRYPLIFTDLSPDGTSYCLFRLVAKDESK